MKPDPEPVHLALSRLRCAPDEAVFVGDSVHDIGSGNAAGVRTIGVLWGAGSEQELREAGAAAIVAAPDEIPPLLAL